MNHTRERFQNGSLRKVMRQSGTAVWEYRFRSHAEPGSPMRQLTLSTVQYPTEAKARVALQAKVLKINGSESYVARVEPTFGVILDLYIQEEELVEILAQPPGQVERSEGLAYSTASTYTSFINKHIRPRWGSTRLSLIRPLEIQDWLKNLPLASKSRVQIKRLLHLLFDRAMLWGLMEVNRNPVELVKVKGGSKRLAPPTVLTPEEFHSLLEHIIDPYRTMAVMAMCTGLRISEVLAVRWEHLDFKIGSMLVQQGVYNGRIGETKTEASKDRIPLDGGLAEVLLDWRSRCGTTESGLIFQSPVTGRCFHAGVLMRNHIKPAGKRIGLEKLGWHSFRHSYRTILNDTGANTGTQQGLMRHASVTTTMNVYGRASMKAKTEANSKLVQMILPNRARCA